MPSLAAWVARSFRSLKSLRSCSARSRASPLAKLAPTSFNSSRRLTSQESCGRDSHIAINPTGRSPTEKPTIRIEPIPRVRRKVASLTASLRTRVVSGSSSNRRCCRLFFSQGSVSSSTSLRFSGRHPANIPVDTLIFSMYTPFGSSRARQTESTDVDSRRPSRLCRTQSSAPSCVRFWKSTETFV